MVAVLHQVKRTSKMIHLPNFAPQSGVQFEYEIGETVFVYTNEGYEQAKVTDRYYHGSTKYYQVDIFGLPQKEAFLRKENKYEPSLN